MIRQGIAIALIVLGTTVAGWAQEVDWQMDLDAAKTSAARQGKLVLIHFSADWCRPCQHLETFVFTSPKLITAIDERVIPVHIDTDLHPELVKQYNVTQIPTDVVIAPTGRVVQKRQSPKDVNNYLRMLESLDSVEKELSQDRAALAQKIDHILESGSNKLPSPTESNAFVPQLARTKAPDASPLGSQLQAKAASQAKLLQQVSANEFQVNQTDGSDRPSNQPAEPHRIINDQFLNDQSNEFQAKARACIQHDSSQSSYAVVQCNDCQSDERTESSTATLRPVAGTLATEARIESVSATTDPGHVRTASNETMAQPQDAAESARISKTPTPALDGNCPVTLLQEGKWQPGNPQFGCIHRGKTYLFTDQEKLSQFQTDPDRFSPILAGFDPVIFHERGELVDGLEQHGVFMGKAPRQRVVLFQSAETRRQFQQNPRLYMSTIRVAIKQSDNLK